MISGTPRVWLLLVCGALLLGACDCEQRVRGWVDGRDDKPREAVVDAGEPSTSSDPIEVEPNETAGSATPIQLTTELRAVRGTITDTSDTDWFALSADTDEPWLIDVAIEGDADLVALVDLGPASDQPLTHDVGEAGKGERLQTLPIGRVARRIGLRAKSGTSHDYTLRFTKRLSGGAIEHEPNDVPALAHPWGVPGELQGFIDRPDDRDVFALAVEEPGLGKGVASLVVKLEVVGPQGVGLVVRVFGSPTFEQPLASMTVPPGGRTSIPNFAVERSNEEGGTELFVVVTSASGFDPAKAYRLRALSLPQTDVYAEVEPNDARPMKLDAAAFEMTGILHAPDDIDRFAFGYWEDLAEADAGRPVDAATGVADAAADLVPDAESEAMADLGSTADAGMGARAAAERAAEVSRWWEMLPQKEAGKTVAQLIVTPSDEWLTLGISWRDDGGEVEERASAPGEPIRLCSRVLTMDRYRFAVRAVEFAAPGDSAMGRYSVEVRQPQLDALENEPNDDRASADRLESGTEQVGYLGTNSEVDVWGTVFDVDNLADPYATRRFEAKVSGRDHDLVVELRDQDGAIVAEVDRAGPGQGERVAVDLPRGLYYLHVRTKVGGSCEPYTVALSP